MAVEEVDPKDPKRLQDKKEPIEVTANNVSEVEDEPASELYRAWVSPDGKDQNPASRVREMQVIQPEVRLLPREQTFSQMRVWKPGRVVQVYEKSKDFDKVLNPLSLKDFNRFIYRRNPSSP